MAYDFSVKEIFILFIYSTLLVKDNISKCLAITQYMVDWLELRFYSLNTLFFPAVITESVL